MRIEEKAKEGQKTALYRGMAKANQMCRQECGNQKIISEIDTEGFPCKVIFGRNYRQRFKISNIGHPLLFRGQFCFFSSWTVWHTVPPTANQALQTPPLSGQTLQWKDRAVRRCRPRKSAAERTSHMTSINVSAPLYARARWTRLPLAIETRAR